MDEQPQAKKDVKIRIPYILFHSLTLALIWMKLTGRIHWNWWQVTAPSWIPLASFLGVMVIFFFIGSIKYLITGKDMDGKEID